MLRPDQLVVDCCVYDVQQNTMLCNGDAVVCKVTLCCEVDCRRKDYRVHQGSFAL